MPIQVNNSTVDAQGYVTTETTQDPAQDPQATAAAAAAAASKTQAQQLASPAVDVGTLPTSTFQGVNASSVAHNAAATLGQSSAPELPYANVAKGEAPTGQHLVSVTSSLNLSDTEAYRILQEAGQKTFELDATLSRSANMGVLNAKNAQVKDLKDQIQGERTSAITQLSFAVLSTVAGGAMGVGGTLLRRSTGEANQALATERLIKKDPANRDAHIQSFAESYAKSRGLQLDFDPKPFHGVNSHAQGTQPGTASGLNTSPNAPKLDDQLPNLNGAPKKTPDGGATPPPDPANPKFDDPSIAKFHEERPRIASSLNGRPTDDVDAIKRDVDQYFKERSGRTQREKINEKVFHSANGKEALGAGLDSSAQGLSNTINNLGTAIDTLAGGKYDADQAKIAQKQDDVQISIAQQVADSSKASKDRAQKQTSDSLDTLKEVAARYAAVIDKLS